MGSASLASAAPGVGLSWRTITARAPAASLASGASRLALTKECGAPSAALPSVDSVRPTETGAYKPVQCAAATAATARTAESVCGPDATCAAVGTGDSGQRATTLPAVAGRAAGATGSATAATSAAESECTGRGPRTASAAAPARAACR